MKHLFGNVFVSYLLIATGVAGAFYLIALPWLRP
jgi:hypothetical protein